MRMQEKLDRLIFMWRRYEGRRVPEGKSYSFADVDELEHRIADLYKHPRKFDHDTGKVRL